MHSARAAVLGTSAALLALAAPALASDFEHPASSATAQQFAYGPPLGPGSPQRQDTPNDPLYDNAEPDTAHTRTSTDLYDELFWLFGFPSQLTPAASYRDGPHAGLPQVSGFNAAGAWKLERGRPDVVIAILDTGIRWDNLGLRRQVHLNTGELPYPLTTGPAVEGGLDCGKYHAGVFDADGDGVLTVDDYACDPRVSLAYAGRSGPAHLITGQDLIHAFGDCQIDRVSHRVVSCTPGGHFDNDQNGYANDIAGWNFFDDNNDPGDLSSYFSATNHGTGRALDAAEQGNDGVGSIGVCPHCQLLPVRTYDTFVSDANDFALGITYATDNGARVIEGANGSLEHTAFAEAASRYAYDHGAVQTFSGDDLNTANHNYPGNYSHTMLIQGTVPDTLGEVKLGVNPGPPVSSAPIPAGTQLPPRTYFRNANITQYGGHSSIAMEGASGSENTSKAAGAAGEVVGAALDRGIALTPDETREIIEQTAERVTTGDTQGTGSGELAADPSAPPDHQWTEHFGWGRADVGAAVALARLGAIPPEAAIDQPDWFAPVTGSSLSIAGRARARFAAGGRFHWKLEWAPGLQPDPGSWHTAASGDASGTLTSFGTLDMAAVRDAVAAAGIPDDPGGPTFSPRSLNPLRDQFNVQLEVSAAGTPTVGIDRRVFTVAPDPALLPGFPKRLGAGGEAAVRFASLTATPTQQLLVPTEDGSIHAYLPNGTELPGWPVHTQPQTASVAHVSSPALHALGLPHEPPRGPVIADLNGDGQPDVITAAGTHLYAWDARGRLVPGFPVSSEAALCGPRYERQPLGHPKCGFFATPAVAHLQGHDRPWDVVEPSLDGHLYAWDNRGRSLPGYPVALVDPTMPAGQRDVAESINDPAIGDLLHMGHDDVVVSSNENYGAQPAAGDVGAGANGLLPDVIGSASGGSARVYAIDGATGRILPGWPLSITGALQSSLPFIGPGNDAELARIGGRDLVIASATGGALSEFAADASRVRTISQDSFGSGSDATDRTALANLFEGAAVGALTPGGAPDVVKYGITLGQVENFALPGQNFAYNHLIGAYDAGSGEPLAAWPTITDDYQFESSSDVANVTGGAGQQVLAGTGLGLLHAYDGSSARDVTGFPKVTGGWLYSPAAVSSDGRLADITREGYLFAWRTPTVPCQSQWPSFRHDQQDSGNYDHDGTPPAAPQRVSLTRLSTTRSTTRYRLAFTSPGDDGMCRTPAAYVTRIDGRVTDLRVGPPGPGGTTIRASVTLPASARVLSVQARDAAGNLGIPVSIGLRRLARLHVRFYGRRRALGAVKVRMSATGEVLTRVTVELRAHGRVVARGRARRVDARLRITLLAPVGSGKRSGTGRFPAVGRYVLVVRVGRRVLLRRRVHLG